MNNVRSDKAVRRKKVIVFDFDGVICDSTEECLITGYNAWSKYLNKDRFITGTAVIPPHLVKYFRFLRGFVKTAGQYYVIFNSYGKKMINNEFEFEKACAGRKGEMSWYEKLFFECRELLKKQDVKYWMGLHRTYDGITRNFRRVLRAADVFVATGKDKASVRDFFEYIGIDFPASKIYDKDTAYDKLAALRQISGVTHKRLREIIFLDDNVNHLLMPKRNGCKTFMAGWGYHTEKQLKLSKDKKIPVIGLEDWVQKILD